MSEELYAITNMNGYVTEMRQAAAKSLSEDSENENLDEYISIDQMVGLVMSKSVGFDDLNRPMLNEDKNEEIFEEIAIWIHNVGLAKLAALDLLECAWSDEDNDMVFWAKEKPKNAKPKSRRKKKNTE